MHIHAQSKEELPTSLPSYHTIDHSIVSIIFNYPKLLELSPTYKHSEHSFGDRPL